MQMSRRGSAVLAVLAVTLIVAGCSDDGSDPAASAAVTATPTATVTVTPSAVSTPGPAATGATGKPSVAVSLAPAVKVGATTKILDDVRVRVGKIREITVKAEQPGQIAGAAAAVGVTVRNGSSRPFSLGGLVVTLSYDNGTPGDQTTSGPSAPLTGSLAPGKQARGTYVFMVPRQHASTLQVQVSSDQSPSIVQFNR